jgi:hypothetical protein
VSGEEQRERERNAGGCHSERSEEAETARSLRLLGVTTPVAFFLPRLRCLFTAYAFLSPLSRRRLKRLVKHQNNRRTLGQHDIPVLGFDGTLGAYGPTENATDDGSLGAATQHAT